MLVASREDGPWRFYAASLEDGPWRFYAESLPLVFRMTVCSSGTYSEISNFQKPYYRISESCFSIHGIEDSCGHDGLGQVLPEILCQ